MWINSCKNSNNNAGNRAGSDQKNRSLCLEKYTEKIHKRDRTRTKEGVIQQPRKQNQSKQESRD